MREAPAIDGYGAGGFTVSGTRIDGSLLILDDKAGPWSPRSLADLTSTDFADVIARKVEVEFVLLGCGLRMAPPPKALRGAFADLRIGLEVMDTPTACRLYNVLASEGRRLAAALLAV
ncbi:Mth938-like domain-containing protein [soil metagenome]